MKIKSANIDTISERWYNIGIDIASCYEKVLNDKAIKDNCGHKLEESDCNESLLCIIYSTGALCSFFYSTVYDNQ